MGLDLLFWAPGSYTCSLQTSKVECARVCMSGCVNLKKEVGTELWSFC